ncbi:MAG: NapC/NirT family cytochrome c [Sedimentisphaerales bacterium]
MKHIKDKFASGINVFRELKLPVKILLIGGVFAFFIAGSLIVTGEPGFCNSCHVMKPYYANWQASSHSEVNCTKCHFEPGFVNYIRGKIVAPAHLVNYAVGRVGTKPSATIKDVSCLRSECHNCEELISKNINYNGIKFTHKNHIKKVIDGMKIACGTCHSHFEGDEHFSINNDVCFMCHFLKGSQGSSKPVQTSCQDCHEVPNTVIERGFVTIDHAEFVSYKASCEDSCHKKEMEKQSQVSDSVCLNCHSYQKGPEVNSVQLHEIHTNCEKVECFACHGEISHGWTKVASVSAMMDCQNCHSDTHEVQRSIYTAQHHPQNGDSKIILSPMFLTHVECSGCHIEQVRRSSGPLDSFGTVAKAVPQACDICHEKGTGQQYIPFWQEKIKELYETINRKLSQLEERTRYETNKQLSEKLSEAVKQASSILESIASDGSWGVHNFKYTEAMLLKADKIITETQ